MHLNVLKNRYTCFALFEQRPPYLDIGAPAIFRVWLPTALK